MDNIVLSKKWVQGGPVIVDNLLGTAFTGEAGAHTFEIHGVDSEQQPVQISGTITANFLAANNVTIALDGSVSDGVASVTLDENCYDVPGRFILSVYATNGSTTLCLYCAVGNIMRTQSSTIAYPTDSLPNITSLMADLQDILDSWPADYSQIEADVSNLKTAITTFTTPTKNLFDVYSLPRKNNITISNGVISGTAAAFAAGYGNNTNGISDGLTFETEKQYTISMMAKNRTGGTGSGLIVRFVYSDASQSHDTISLSYTDYTFFKVTSTSGKTVSKIVISYASVSDAVWDIKDVQIEAGSAATEYVPHLTAYDENARDNVDIINDQIDLMNSRNLFTKVKTQTKYDNSLTYTSNGDGFITLNGSYESYGYFDIATMEDLGITAGNDYYISYGSPSDSISYLSVYADTGSGMVEIYANLCGINKIHIPESTTDLLLRLITKGGQSFSNTKYRLTVSEALSNTDLAKPSAQMYFLEAFGTGDSTIIKFADGTTLVIDFGLNEPQDTLYNNWNRAIDALDITHIDYAIISHYHGDHLGMLFRGISNLIDSNTTFFTAAPYTDADLEGLAWMDSMSGDHVVQNYTQVTEILNNAGVKRVYPTEGQSFTIGGADVTFWNCDHREWLDMFINHTMYDYNHCSLCNYITIGSQRICFSGDIGELVMEKYKTSVLQSQIFKVNHHCIGYDVVPLFLNSLMPELCVSMLGHGLAVNNLGTNPMQTWCEDNFVPNVVTGINEHNVPIYMDDGGYKFITSCRKLICADEGISTT